MPVELPPKKDVALALLEHSTVYIHLDPRPEAVHVPPWFKKQPQLVLQIGLNMAIPIRDLRLDDEAVSCTLSFNRSPFFCRIPWKSVFALIGEDRRGMVWPGDVPPEVAVQVEAQARRDPAPPEAAKRPGLRVVSPDVGAPAPPAPELTPTEAPPEPPARKKPRAPSRKRASSRKASTEKQPARPRKKPARPPVEAAAAPGKRALPPYLRVVK
jgi:stringent starvation protein B